MPFSRRRRRIASEVDDEVRLHLALRVQALIAAGRSPEEAEREALERFGDLARALPPLVDAAHRRERRLTTREWLRAAAEESRHAVRQVLRTPALTVAVMVTMALGLGANATMYAVVVRMLFTDPPHVADLRGLRELALVRTSTGLPAGRSVSYPAYKAIRDSGVFASIAAASSPVEFSLGRGPEAGTTYGLFVNADYFRTLGVQPHAGRFFGGGDEVEPAGPSVVVLSHAVWLRHYGGDPAILDRAIDLGRTSCTVVGIAPEGFRGLSLSPTGVWLPITAAEPFRNAGPGWVADARTTWLRLVGRTGPGVGDAEAAARATAALHGSGPPEGQRDRVIRLQAVTTNERGFGEREDLRVPGLVTAISTLVLLIACANVAHLLLAKAARRSRETALLMALGARRSRVVLGSVLEALLLCALGAAAALLVVRWGSGLVRALLFAGLEGADPGLDVRTIAYVMVVGAGCGALIGIMTALRASRADLVAGLRGGGRQHSPASSSLRTALVGAQTALSVVLLIGTGLFLQSLRRIEQVPLGMEPRDAWFATMNLRSVGFSGAQAHEVFARMEAQLRASPDVDAAASALTVPFWSTWGTRVALPGDRTEDAPIAWLNAVSPAYFETIGTRVTRGRSFTDEDARGTRRVLVINQSLARLRWPDSDPLAACVELSSADGPCWQVVGIAEDVVQENIAGGPRGWALQVYLPLAQAPPSLANRVLVVRTRSLGRAAAIGHVRRLMQGTAPGLAGANVRAFADVPDLSSELRPWRLGSSMFGTFGSLAVLLAVVGLYGVLSFGVTERTREFGVRIALGATRGHILRRVIGHGLVPVLAGGTAGAAATLLAARWIEPLLFQTSPRDPTVYAAVASVLLATGVLAGLLPALRATRVNPIHALRAE